MPSPTFSERRGDELLIYVRGQLVMKRWLHTGVSATFHIAPSGAEWSPPIRCAKPPRPPKVLRPATVLLQRCATIRPRS